MSYRLIVPMVGLLVLAACHAQPPRPTPEELAKLAPADVREAKLYTESCKACHARPDSGAPLTHDQAAWDPRWAKGMPTLLAHAVIGFQAMPAGGQCATCTREDFEALIRFMADREETK